MCSCVFCVCVGLARARNKEQRRFLSLNQYTSGSVHIHAVNRPKNISDKHLLSSPLTLSWEGEPEWPLPRVEELAVWKVVELCRASVWLFEGACVGDADVVADTWVVALPDEEPEWTAAVVAVASVCGDFDDVAEAVECVSGWFNCVTDVFVDGVAVAVMLSECVSSCCVGLVAVELGGA